ncbi:MAG: CRISPR-associated RAMP protein, partial [Thermoproteales archaeon]|nr:CRISPR-associated RAMP protein [Thermoproteales archaeon]
MSVFNVWIDDRFIAREIKLSGKLVTKGPLRIGAGREAVSLESSVDLPVLRRAGSGEPYIPGTSLKGVFRSTSERLARIKKLSVCSGLSKQTCMDKIYGNDTLLRWFDRKRREARKYPEKYEEISKEIVEVIFRETCLMCKLFGAPSISGRIFFFDADPASPDSYRISSRKGIAISRYTGSASRGALYEVEYVEPGSIFIFN